MKHKPDSKDIQFFLDAEFGEFENPDYDESSAFRGLEEMIDDAYEAGVEQGQEDGYKDGLNAEWDAHRIEELNVNYVVKQFEDCNTLHEFQEKLREITTRSYNFM